MIRRYEATVEEKDHHTVISVSERNRMPISSDTVYKIADDLDALTEITNLVLSINDSNKYNFNNEIK